MSTPIPQQCHPVHPKLAFHQLSPCHVLQQPPELEPAAGRREGLPHLIYCRFVCCQSRVQLGGAWSRWGWEVQLSSAFDPTERRIPRAVAEEPGHPSSPFPALQMEDYRSYWKSIWAQGLGQPREVSPRHQPELGYDCFSGYSCTSHFSF